MKENFVKTGETINKIYKLMQNNTNDILNNIKNPYADEQGNLNNTNNPYINAINNRSNNNSKNDDNILKKN